MSSLTAFHRYFGETQVLQYNEERKLAVWFPHAAWDTGHQGMRIQICSSSLRPRKSPQNPLLPFFHFPPFFVLFSSKQSICSDLSAHPWLKLGSCVRANCIVGSRAGLGDQSPWLLVATRHCWDLTACATSVNTRSSVLTQSSHGTSGEPLLPVKYEGAGTHLTQSASLVIPDLDDKFCMRDFCLSVHSHDLSGKPFGQFIHHTRLCRKTIL